MPTSLASALIANWKSFKAIRKMMKNPVAKQMMEQMKGMSQATEKLYVCETCRMCRNAVVETKRLAERLSAEVEKLNLPDRIKAKIEGPVLFHHSFRIALSGCPNSCSQPQIKDFGVQGRAKPGLGPGECDNCGRCVAACEEGAVSIIRGAPVFDSALCVECGQCARACPTKAIVIAERGYRVLVGGKVGRHPQFGQVLLEMATADVVCDAAVASAEAYICEGKPGERFGSILNRLGINWLKVRLIPQKERRGVSGCDVATHPSS